MTEYLTVAQAAARLHCKPRSLADHIRAGELVATKPGGRWLIRPADLDAYIESKRNVQPAPKRVRRGRRRAA